MLPRDYIMNFCATKDDPFHKTRPAMDSDRLLATDGNIAIVTHDDADVAAFANPKLVAVIDEVLRPIKTRDRWLPVDMDLPPPQICGVCGGIGRTVVCNLCGGEGVLSPDDEGVPQATCPVCSGHGIVPYEDGFPCVDCEGHGEEFQLIKVGGSFFARRYLALLQSLPGPVMLSPGPGPTDVAFFRFAVGHGALMPCRMK